MCRYGRALFFSSGFRFCSPAVFINNNLSTIHQRAALWLTIIDRVLRKIYHPKPSSQSEHEQSRCDVKESPLCRSLCCFVPQ